MVSKQKNQMAETASGISTAKTGWTEAPAASASTTAATWRRNGGQRNGEQQWGWGQQFSYSWPAAFGVNQR